MPNHNPNQSFARSGRISRSVRVLAVASALMAPGVARAAELRPLVLAPAPQNAPPVVLAVSFEMKLYLRDGKDLADLLLEAGVDKGDTAAAAELALDRIKPGTGSFVRLSVSRSAENVGLRLQRLTIVDETDQTVVERRQGKLKITASGRKAAKSPFV